jgi:hypothetical protein
MDWIIPLIAIITGTLLLTAIVWKAKAQHFGPIAGRFDFGRYKAKELSQRGLFHKSR